MFTHEEAIAVLTGFNCLDVAPNLSDQQRRVLQRSLLLVAAASDLQILGVCADSLPIALAAVKTYAQALQCPPERDLEQRGIVNANQPVYIKYNGRSGLFYAEPYEGHHRGVLVSCQSDLADGFSGMFGHLPLDLFP